jgi:hypothetical protein
MQKHNIEQAELMGDLKDEGELQVVLQLCYMHVPLM